MSAGLEQHNQEIQRNREVWERKRLLRDIYTGFYRRILRRIDPRVPGAVVEIGSGIGNLKAHFPSAIATDLFPNPWLDLVCDGYELPFRTGTLSHLVMFDVFHHLEAPMAFLAEARRALGPGGRLILFEPYVSWASLPVYGLLHPEPVAMRARMLDKTDAPPHPRRYYAAQGNATRLFFRRELSTAWSSGWSVLHREAFSCFHYLLSGGYSKPAVYPAGCAGLFRGLDNLLSRWPRAFGGRCLVVLTPSAQQTA